MENLKEFLSSMGFGKNEAEIYTALVEQGPSSVLEISKFTKIHRSNIYDAVRNLISQGFVYEINADSTKRFIAREPKSLLNFIKRREIELDEFLKQYEKKQHINSKKELFKVSGGVFAAREAINSLLENGDSICVYGIPIAAPEIIGPMLKDFHKERIRKKIQMNHIYDSSGLERIHYLNKMPYTEAKLLPKKYDSNATTNISGDKVVIIIWNKEISVIEMYNSEIARTYKNYFDILWRNAKTVPKKD